MKNEVQHIESNKTGQGITAVDIINELRETVKLIRTNKPEYVLDLINKVISKNFMQAEGNIKYTNIVLEIKEYIKNIKNNCPFKPTKCIVFIEWTLKNLDGGA